MPKSIYLDYAATTPVDPRVAECMSQLLVSEDGFGNAASIHHVFGRRARDRVEQARLQVATLINAAPHEIVWTSGATESINLALKGVMHARDGGHLITCATEHKAVLDVCMALEMEGFAITRLGVDSGGGIDFDELRSALRPDTVLISLLHANNETGRVHDIERIGELARDRNILFHVDAAQSAGKLPLDVVTQNLDLISLTAHKAHGPKGVGALYVRQDPALRLQPLIDGGGHEWGMRAGTLATHQIVGMGEAFRLAGEEMDAGRKHAALLRKRLLDQFRGVAGISINCAADQTLEGIVSLTFEAVDAEELLLSLPQLALSAGAACASATAEPSHVLRAMGLDDERISSSIRISFGRFTTLGEIDRACELLGAQVKG